MFHMNVESPITQYYKSFMVKLVPKFCSELHHDTAEKCVPINQKSLTLFRIIKVYIIFTYLTYFLRSLQFAYKWEY